MEMALRPRNPLCLRSTQALVFRPAGSGGLAQTSLLTSRFTRSRIARCMAPISDSAKRKSRRMVSPQVKVISSGGYMSRLTVEPITKKREHNNGDEETLGTYNTLLSTDTTEWTGSTEAETAEADPSQNASSSSIIGELDVVDEDIFVVDLTVNALSSVTKGEIHGVDEARVETDIFEVDLAATALSSAIMGEVDVLNEIGAVQATVAADLSGKVSSSVTTAEEDMVDEVVTVQDTFEVTSSGNVSTSVKMCTLEAISSGNVSTSAMVGEVNAVETGGDQDTFEPDLSGNASSSATYGEVDEARVEEQIFENDMLGSISGNEKHMAVDSVAEATDKEETYQQQYLTLSSISMWSKAIDKTGVSLKPVLPLVRVQEQGKSNPSDHVQEGSIVAFSEHNQPTLTFHEQQQSIIAFDKQNKPIATFSKQDQYISAFLEKNKSMAASDEQGRLIVDLPDQDQSIIGSHKQHKSVPDVPEQIQSIVSSSNQDQSIVAFHKQDQSIVSAPKQKQHIVPFRKHDLSILGLHKQNLSSVGTMGEGQTKQVHAIDRQDALLAKEMEATDVNYNPQKTNGDALHLKFDTENLSQEHQANRTEEALEMTTSKKVDEAHIFMTEHQIGVAEGQMIVTEDGLSVTKYGTRIGDKIEHLLSAKEFSWDEDEMGSIQDDEQYEADEISISVEPDIQDSPQDVVDPKEVLQELADQNYLIGNKLFIFPEVVKSDSVIDLYLNRDLTALANEPDVIIKGAFNGWRWRPFTEKLHKSELGGVWWSCKLCIPKEAYRLDFVFFNGRSVYENNGKDDFFIEIKGTMDEDLFEDFLVKQKQRELEMVAAEEVERRTQTVEQCRKKEERAAAEAVRAQVKAEIEMKKNKLHNMLSLAKTSADNLWYIEASTDTRGAIVRLYYNRNSTPLVHSTQIWMHGGYNNWTDGLSIVERLVKCNEKDGDWWYADVIQPENALVLDWVFADGPPGNARNYDNNGRQDFHAILPNISTEEGYWVQEEQNIYARLLQERREREEAIKRKAERSAKMKAEMKAKTMRRFLLSQKHIVYTEPLEIRAGTTVDVLYNPSNTVLNGKPEVWFRCSFNLWMHPGVQVPPDAYMMDFVFSELEEGGIYDNRDGMDYHIPISDSVETETYMHIVHIAVEMAPIAKVGGLGDVVTSLSRAVQDLGHTVEVILPKYDCLKENSVSQTYSREVAGHGAIAPHREKFYGILNGIDPDIWDPYTDNCIPVPYTSENIVEGKTAAKRALQQKLGLQQTDVPIVGIISRLTAQKGIHLIKHAIYRTLESNGQVVLLGSAPDHRIQGLYDTIFDVDNDKDRARSLGLETNGFSFDGADSNGVDYALNRQAPHCSSITALASWFDARDWFHSLCKRVMEQDWSWNRPALDYIELYHSARKF
ncbi:hypothetical protein ACQ4PT_047560 [Festuca glaucescens]